MRLKEQAPPPDRSVMRQSQHRDRMCRDTNRSEGPTSTWISIPCGASGRFARHHGRTCIRFRRCWPTSSNTRRWERIRADRDGTRASRRRRARAEVVSSASERQVITSMGQANAAEFRHCRSPWDSPADVSKSPAPGQPPRSSLAQSIEPPDIGRTANTSGLGQKRNLTAKLHLPRRPRAENASEVRGERDAVRDVEVHPIQQAEGLPSNHCCDVPPSPVVGIANLIRALRRT